MYTRLGFAARDAEGSHSGRFGATLGSGRLGAARCTLATLRRSPTMPGWC